jgi:hypothetical protein
VIYVSDRVYDNLRLGGPTRGKWRILDEKVESDLMSDSELQGGSPPPVSIKDHVGCALFQQALSCVLTHMRFMGSREFSSLSVIELDDTLPHFTGVY